MSSPFEFLSKRELLLLIELITRFSNSDNHETYIRTFNSLKSLIPFDYATSAMVTVNEQGVVESYDLVNINYTDDWIRTYGEQNMHLSDVTVEENFKTYKTQCWSDTYKKYGNPERILSFANDFNLTNGYTCGAKAFGMYKKPSYVSFAWNFKERCERISSIIDLITPYIHIALSNVLYAEKKMLSRQVLTKREREILSWTKDGKSSWEISSILKISEATVNYHVTNILKKLDSVNRTQAVAVALQHGIIDFD